MGEPTVRSELADPWALALIALAGAAVVAGVLWNRRTRPVLPLPVLGELTPGGLGARARLAWVAPALRWLALAAFAVALAAPTAVISSERVLARGVAMMVVIDRSWSMTERIEYDGRQMSRIGVVKRVFREFVEGDGDSLGGRPHDLIGLVSFARYAETVCPPTASHGVLVDLVDGLGVVDPERNRFEAGTAIGEGVALAAARLAELAGPREDGAAVSGLALVLLTDGDENAGEISAADAAQLCAELGVRAHVIGVAGGEPKPSFGRVSAPTYEFTEGDLRAIADRAGGIYRVATDAASLREIYREIDALEKAEIETTIAERREDRSSGWLALGLALVVIELAVSSVLLREGP